MRFASVYFKHTENGWRVSYIRESNPHPVLDGYAFRALFDKDEIAITGFVPSGIRPGQFCKRPHKIIKVKEFRK